MNYTDKMFKNDELKSKTILITGGGTGLGKSMATYFLELGANIIIASRKEDVINSTVEELKTLTKKDNIVGYVCDVRDYVQVEKVINLGIAQFGAINGLVNNAAGNFISPTERLSHKAFDVITDIVLKGSYNCSLALGKYWIANQIKGNVVNIVTTYSWTGSGYVVPSACAKAGVLALTRSLASEWAKYGIKNNAIAPGPFPTQGAFSRLFPDAVAKNIDPLKRIPLKRFGEHQELANLAAYLMSDFSAYINGEVVTIDGGEWIYNAGEFNSFDAIPNEMWDEVEKHVRGKNKCCFFAMLKKIKLNIAQFLLNKKNKNFIRKVRAIGLDKAIEIGIIYDATNRMEYEAVKKLTNYLIEERKKVATLGYINSKKGSELMSPHLHYRYFDNNNLSRLMIPKGNEVDKFIVTPFQILIDLTMSDCFPNKYITTLSVARFKVGACGDYRDEACDLTIALKENKSIDQLILQIKHYLKMINAN